MSFTNANTPSNQPADPYKATNKDEPDLKTKIGDLVGFVERQKFGMMTTRIAPKGLLVSRCMAVAGKVRAERLPLRTLYSLSTRGTSVADILRQRRATVST